MHTMNCAAAPFPRPPSDADPAEHDAAAGLISATQSSAVEIKLRRSMTNTSMKGRASGGGPARSRARNSPQIIGVLPLPYPHMPPCRPELNFGAAQWQSVMKLRRQSSGSRPCSRSSA